MTLDEAIRVIESEVECWHLHPEEAYPKAFKLGIEALKRLQFYREGIDPNEILPLPGETEE